MSARRDSNTVFWTLKDSLEHAKLRSECAISFEYHLTQSKYRKYNTRGGGAFWEASLDATVFGTSQRMWKTWASEI